MNRLLRVLTVLCMVLLMIFPSMAEETPAVRVDDVCFSAEEIRTTCAVQLSMLYSADLTVDEETVAAVMRQAVDSYVTRGLAEKRIRELKLDRMTENRRQQLLEQARQTFDGYWRQTREAISAEEMDDGEVTAFLENGGITVDWLYRELVYQDQVQALMKYEGFVPDVSDEEAEAFYEDNYVKPFRDRYEGNVPLFENEILIPGNETLYIPEGYRVIRQLILPVTQDVIEKLEAVESRAAEVQAKMETISGEAAARALRGEKVPEEDRNAYMDLQDENDRLAVQHGEIWSAFYLGKQDVLDEIEVRLQSGETFDSVCESFGGRDADVMFHPESIYLPEEITESLLTLRNVGEVSRPCLYMDGIHVFCYAEDMKGGALPLSTEENLAYVRAMAMSVKQEAFLTAQTENLRDRYEIAVDQSQLNY